MQNDLVLSDLGRTVTSITDGANDRYLSAKRVYQRVLDTTIYQRQTCVSESLSPDRFSVTHVY